MKHALSTLLPEAAETSARLGDASSPSLARAQMMLGALLIVTETLAAEKQAAGEDVAPFEAVESVDEERLADLLRSLLNCQYAGIVLLDDACIRPLLVACTVPGQADRWRNCLQGEQLYHLLSDPGLVAHLQKGEILLLDVAAPFFHGQSLCMLVAPVLAERDDHKGSPIIGLLLLGYESVRPLLTEQELAFIRLMAGIALLAMMRERARQERDQALTSLRNAQEELECMDKIKGNFAVVMNHGFRSALLSIQGSSELMRDSDLSVSEMKEFAIDIALDARRLLHLLNDLLKSDSMETGRRRLNLGWLDLNAIISEVVNRLRPTTHRHLIRLQLARALPVFIGDAEKLTFAISHLLTNAIQFSPDGGEICISSLTEGNVVHVSVCDQGMGIPVLALERIFEDSPHGNKGEMRGLLAVREIVLMHGGEIWVESSVGVGSIFHFTVPFILLTPP